MVLKILIPIIERISKEDIFELKELLIPKIVKLGSQLHF
jgi:hypothetical protein